MAARNRDARWCALLVGVTLLAIYVVVQRDHIASYDGNIMLHLAQRIVTKHTLTVDPAFDALHTQSPYPSYGFGTTLFEVPFVALQRWIAPASSAIVTLANPVLLAATGAVLVLVGRRLGWHPAVCTITALAAGLLTPALWQSTEGFSEPGVGLGALVAVLGVLVWRDGDRGGPLLVGAGIAAATLWRPDSLVLVAPFVLVAAAVSVPRARLLQPRALLAVAGPMVAVGAFQCWYDFYRYGSILRTGYNNQAHGEGFDTPILEGLDFLLRSPGRGFFWTAPILLVALPGFWYLWRRERLLTLTIAALAIARLCFFACWFTPGGGVGWGPRFLFPLTWLLAIPAGELVDQVRRWAPTGRRLAAWLGMGCLAAVSGAVSLLAVAVPYEFYWNEWVNRAPRGQRLVREHSYYWSLADNAMVGAFRSLSRPHPDSLSHFAGGPHAIAFVALAVAVAALIVALRVGPSSHPPRNSVLAD